MPASWPTIHSGQQVQVIWGKLKDGPKSRRERKGSGDRKEFVYVTQIVVTVDDKPPTKPDKIK